MAGVAKLLPAWARAVVRRSAGGAGAEAAALLQQMERAKPGSGAFVRAAKRLARVEQVVASHSKFEAIDAGLREARELQSDPEMAELAKAEAQQLEAERGPVEEELVDLLIPRAEGAAADALLEVRPGVGGEEASLFAEELLGMYERLAALKGWRWEPLTKRDRDQGIRGCVVGVSAPGGADGEGVYGMLRFENGVHRVQRVPVTESQGRVHTSTATVVVQPDMGDEGEGDFALDPKDLKVTTMRAGGAGGQHVNTTDSAVRIVHEPTKITVMMQDERSQLRNKDKAMRILRARVYDHFAQIRMAERNALRSKLVGTGDRSEKVRTYNYARDQIVDHRLGGAHGIHGIEELMREPEALERAFWMPIYCQEVLEELEQSTEASLPPEEGERQTAPVR